MQLFMLLCRLPGKISLRYFLPLLFLFACHLATGQVKKTTAPPSGKTAAPVVTPSNQVASTGGSTPASLNSAVKAPLVRNMEDFKKTPQYAKRKAAYDKNSPGPQSKTVKFQDGSKITISLDKAAPTSPVTGPVKKKIGPEKKESSGGMDCIVNNVQLTATSNSFLNNDYSGTTANIYPGACYTYANLTNGSWKEQTGARNAIMITTDNPNAATSYVTVQNPNVGTLNAAVSKLFAGMKGPAATESLAYNVTEAENSSTYNLQIGAAASGYGVDLSNVYTTGNQSNHVHMTIDATKTLFTISTVPPDSGFFSDPKVEAIPYLSVIGEVSYGVRVLANADLTFANETDADNFKGSYSGVVNVSLKVKYSSDAKSTNTTINGYIIGGPGSTVVAYSLDELQKQIDEAFAKATFQNARPIKYKSYSMAGDILNTYSATDQFAERSCTPSNGGSPDIQNVVVTFTQGGDGKEAPTQFTVGLFAGISSDPNPNLDDAMFIYQTGGAQNYYANNGTATIVLTRNPKYKGKYDEGTLQKAGGHLHMYPLNYKPFSAAGIGADVWQITNVKAIINLTPSSVNPNPQPIGGTNGISWALSGPNQVNLHSDKNTTADWLFNANFAEIGAP
jgi:hypothetical protein